MIEQTQAEIDFSKMLEERLRAIDEKVYSVPQTVNTDDFVKRLESLTAQDKSISEQLRSDDQESLLFSRLQESAAVSGGLRPDSLLKTVLDENLKQRILSWFVSLCLVETRDTENFWTLKQSQRIIILSNLLQTRRLDEVLRQKLPETDIFGKLLRKVLKQNKINLKTLNNESLLALTTVIESLNELRDDFLSFNSNFVLPKIEEIRPLITKTSFLSDYDVLLENGFYGREAELEKFYDFLNSDDPNVFPYWTGVVLTGIGGAGKTTLLAKFLRDVVNEKKATVAVLDFDRPGIDPHDFYWLEAEISRQIGQQYADITEDLRSERQLARQDKFNVDQTAVYSESESPTELRSSRLLYDFRYKLSNVTDADKPFLLILDTFEEAAQQGFTGRILSWLNEVGEIFTPIPVKVIFSGRLFDYEEGFANQPMQPEIEVGEFEPSLAAEYLEKLEVNQPMASRIAFSNFLPRRPLELKLVAKLILENPSESIEQLEKEVSEGGELAKELFAGIVYRRILLRIDKELRQFAYPGLTLRYLTAELIQKVLVPALEIKPPLEDFEAEEALEKLANYRWLTYTKQGDADFDLEVWHRKDLRRSMLKAMMHEQKKVCERISKAAVRFFKDGNERERAEAVYHRLMLLKKPEDGESIEPDDLMKARESIGADIADLPPAGSALLRFVSERKIPLEEIELLPKQYLADAYQDAGNNLVLGRQYQKALSLLNRGQETGIALGIKQTEGFESIEPFDFTPAFKFWEAETLYATASWKELINVLETNRSTAEINSLQDLTGRLFPAIIIEPSFYSNKEIEQMLADAFDQKALHHGTIIDLDTTTRVSRLAMCLILADARQNLSEKSREIIRFVLEQIYYSNAQGLSASLRKRLSFLQLICDEGSEFDASLYFSTLQLDPKWISDLLSQSERFNFNDDFISFIVEIKNVLESELNAPPPRTIKKLLNAVDNQKRQTQPARNQFNPVKLGSKVILKFFRGPDPDFRDPCRFALLEAFSDRAEYEKLGKIFASVINFELDDLEPEKFVEAISTNAEHALESYIELVDRQWRFGDLLGRALEEKPDSDKLWRVSGAYQRWDEAVRSACRKQNNG